MPVPTDETMDVAPWRQVRVAILGPFPPRPGGVSMQCAILADALAQSGASVTRITTDVPGLRGRGRLRKGVFPLAQMSQITRQLHHTRDNWDILHVHVASWWGFMPAVLGLRARGWGKRLVVTYHGGEAAQFMARHGRWAAHVLSRYQALLTLTPTQAAIFRRYGLSSMIVPNFVPLAAFTFRQRGPISPRLLWLRSLDDRYRPADALAVFARVSRAYPQATLHMAGTGPLMDALQKQAHTMGLSGVHFLGHLPPADVPRAYDEAELFLNTSTVDNLPLTLIEASASGLPIVSTNAGAIPDLIHDGEDGLLAPVGDVETLAGHILRLLSDAALARRLSQAAHENAHRFSWSQIAPLLAQAYGVA